jgi:hypothetical protein
LVGALGIDLGDLTAELRAVLSEFGYRTTDIHLTDAFADFPWPRPLIESPYDERVWSYMDAGDLLREKWNRKDAVALIAVQQVGAAREDLTGDLEIPSGRTAYILRSLKRPEEVVLLRAVYGRRFLLVGAATHERSRLEYLREAIRRSRIAPHSRTQCILPRSLRCETRKTMT